MEYNFAFIYSNFVMIRRLYQLPQNGKPFGDARLLQQIHRFFFPIVNSIFFNRDKKPPKKCQGYGKIGIFRSITIPMEVES